MDDKNYYKNIIVALPFIIAAFTSVFVFNYLFIYLIPFVIATYLVVANIIKKLDLKREEINELKELSNILEMLYVNSNNNYTITENINDILSKINKNSRFYYLLKNFNNKHKLGKIPLNDSNINLLEQLINNALITNNFSNIENTFKNIRHKLAILNEEKQASLNKYLILSTVFETVVPSLSIFSVISYAIFSNFNTIMLPFSFVLLIIIPSILIPIILIIDDINE
ncbi:MAG: hypothetical protein ACP5RI_00260 [Candidatus Micrarchaeia archaeon]